MNHELHLEMEVLYYEFEARDVMHSISISVFRLELDAIPGRVISRGG